MKKNRVQTLKGFRDFLPEEAIKRQYVIDKLRLVFEEYGFEPLETPALEYAQILEGKYGNEGNKLIYKFEDRGGRKVAMRYDQTVPLARVIAQYGEKIPMPFKRYQIQPVWRAENPQKGRFREFLQCDIDIISSPSLLSDAEIIACALEVTKRIGFKNAKMLINNRSVLKGLKKEFLIAMDKLGKIGKNGVIQELMEKGMNKEQAEKFVNSFDEKKPTPISKDIFKHLEQMGYKKNKDFKFEPTLVRGLDYYTSSIFELVCPDYKSGSLGGGGRYDNLIGMFTDKQIPAVGFAFGFDRLVEAMEELDLLPAKLTSTQVLVTVFSPELLEESIKLARKLRIEKINTELYPISTVKLDQQLKYANKKSIPFVLIVGPEEVKEKKYTFKNMKTCLQKKVSFQELLGIVKAQ